MITPDHIKLHTRTVKAETAYMSGRVRKLAHKITSMEVCVEGHTYTHFDPHHLQGKESADSVRADILCKNIAYMGRSVGRRAQGAHMPTQGFVCVGSDYRLRVAHGPTSKVKDAKAHKALRVEACTAMHANVVDASRRFAYMTAPFRKGGSVYAKVSKRKRNRFRAILHKADGFRAAGEIAVALELARAL